jgi:hypothetical protein
MRSVAYAFTAYVEEYRDWCYVVVFVDGYTSYTVVGACE